MSSSNCVPSRSDYGHQDFQYVNGSIDDEEGFHFLGLEFLQRLHIQNELLSMKEEIFEDQKSSDDAQKRPKGLMHDYGKPYEADKKYITDASLTSLSNTEL